MHPRHQQFINEYVVCWNATEAYSRVYPNASRETARRNGHELLTNTDISQELDRRLAEKTMSADEVLVRQTDIGRSDIGEFINLGPEEIKHSGRSHLIRKFTRTITTTTKNDFESTTESFFVEMYDAQAAQVQMGKHHKLWTEKSEVSGPDGKPIEYKEITDALTSRIDSITTRIGTGETSSGVDPE
jgi:terminase small subunit-like protein